jgi:hypothetical protein
MREEYRQRKFDIRTLRRIVGSKRGQIVEVCKKKLHIEELRNL